jgi:hypothetical protein
MLYNIINIIIGLIIGIFIGYLYKTKGNKYNHGPNSTKLRKKIYYDEKTNSCYKFKPVVYICPISLSMKNI